MNVGAGLAVLLALAVALAGCGGKGAPNEDDSGPNEETHGTIEGVVVDDESIPIGDALIAIKTVKVSPLALRSRAGEDGSFRLENIPAGRQTVEASKEGYNEASTSVTVVPGDTTPVRLVLTAKPSNVYSKTSLSPIIGHYDCAMESITHSGECDYEVRNQTGQRLFQTKNNASFEVPANWGGLLFELRWSMGTDLSSLEGVRFIIESQEEPGGQFVRTSAQASPVRVAIKAGEVVAGSTLGYAMPQRGVQTWIKVLPQGKLEGATCAAKCGFGAGAALNLEYEVFPTIFFGGPVDPEYSALPKT